MSAPSILSSLPYYTAPVVQLNTEGESVNNFINNCARDGRAGVVGIFPDKATPSEISAILYSQVYASTYCTVNYVYPYNNNNIIFIG